MLLDEEVVDAGPQEEGLRRRHNLRAQPTPLIGRAGELTLAAQVLMRDDTRMVTFTGPAGTGKTRLATALAASLLDTFADGVFFVDLSRIEDSGLVDKTIAETLSIHETRDQPLFSRVENVLFGRQVLLVLDNFEHVLPAAGQVAELLGLCPDLKIVATSRTPLRLRWEHVFPVRPLSLAPPQAGTDAARVAESSAVQLFVERARAADPSFKLSDSNAAVVAEVCARLDGLPLAIELAAARARHLPPAVLLARLSNRLDVLVEGARDLPDRHRSLREAITYSYDLLSVAERALLNQLAVFPRGCTADAAAEVMSESVDAPSFGASILDRLETLVDHSLLQREQLASGETRFYMLETVREYALDQLDRSGRLIELRNGWIDYLLELVHRARGRLLGRDQASTLDLLEREHDSLRAALRWCIDAGDAARGLQLAAGLWRFWHVRGLYTEGRTWLAELLALPGASQQTATRASALSAAGALAYNQGDDGGAAALQTESLSMWRELGDRRGIANALTTLGALADRRGNSEQAVVLLEESLLVKRECQDTWGVAETLVHLGDVATKQGHYSTARARYEDSLLAWLDLGDIWSLSTVLESFAVLAQARGQSARALRLMGAAVGLRENLRMSYCPPAQSAQLQAARQAAEDTLGREPAVAAVAEGQQMDLERAVLYARTVEEQMQSRKATPVGLPAQGPLAWLTPREREVAALLLRGLSNRHIAEELVITERTAETHVCRILSKLGLDSRAQIAAWIIDNGLIDVRARAS